MSFLIFDFGLRRLGSPGIKLLSGSGWPSGGHGVQGRSLLF